MTGNIGCDGKKSYPTYWQARKSTKSLNRQSGSAHANFYKCNNCNAYHVGNHMGTRHYAERIQTTKHYRPMLEESWVLRDGDTAASRHTEWYE